VDGNMWPDCEKGLSIHIKFIYSNNNFTVQIGNTVKKEEYKILFPVAYSIHTGPV